MKGAVISILINALVFASFWFEIGGWDNEANDNFVISWILIIALFMSLAGTYVYHRTRSGRAGFIAIVGFSIYVPIGLLGAISLRKEMDREAAAVFTQNSTDSGKVSKGSVAETEFRYNQKQSGSMMLVGLLSIIVMFFLGKYYLLAISSLPLILGLLDRDRVVLKFRKDFLELKQASLAPTVYLKYTDIQDLKADAKKVVIILRQAQKPIHLYLILFDKNQREDVVLLLKKKIKDLSAQPA